MMPFPLPTRRHALAGLGAAIGLPLIAAPAAAASFEPVSGEDQSAALQQAIDTAVAEGTVLVLPAGTFAVQNLEFPAGIVLQGMPGATVLLSLGGPIANASNADSITLFGLTFTGASTLDGDALLAFSACTDLSIERCQILASPATGVSLYDCSGTIRNSVFSGHERAAIHALDSRGLLITGNRIEDCGNAGIRIWRNEPGIDGSIITENRISRIDWRAGGNGENGNGINVFKADGVIVSNNHFSGCAFSTVRLNSTNDTQVSGNVCLDSGEVAIFSEFAFSGSVIANNIIDRAAGGISITNFDQGGQLAVCSGNIVRNILPVSRVNPDASAFGIFAEAEAAITGNTLQKIPGTAITAGYGPYLKNVLISGNTISQVDTGIAVSVAEGAGRVHIADNLIDATLDHDIVGMAWEDLVEPDLLANASSYPNVTVGS
jgi:uncharacterized secreted repeat protein (TIGR03808 family)